MQSRTLSWMTALIGALLIVLALLPTSTPTSIAAPVRALTPTAEPPTPTATPVPPTATPTNTPVPPPATPTATPVPPTATPTPVPGLPAATPSATPVPPEAPASTPVAGFADPAITKTANVSTASIGSLVEYTLTVTNLGNLPADNVVVVDSLPAVFDLVEVTTSRGTASTNAQTITVAVGTVLPGEVITIRIVARVNTTAQPSQVRNVAVVSTTSPGDNPANNTAEAIIEIVAQGAVAPSSVPTPGSLPQTGSSGNPSALLLMLGVVLLCASLLLQRRKQA